MNGKGVKPDGTEGQSVNMQMAGDKKLDRSEEQSVVITILR